MTVTAASHPSVLDQDTLAEIARVRASGVLGATGRLLELFDFLAARSADDRPPKEAEIALAVFGKSDSEATRDDPVARVYIHRLRKRLDEFYLRNGAPGGVRLDIPKGEYRIVAVAGADRAEASAPAASVQETISSAAPTVPVRRQRWAIIAAGLAILVLGANIAAWIAFANRPPERSAIANTGLWSKIANSPRPLLIVVGDYYMFGEYEDRVRLKRLVRDFTINSKEDLIHSQRGNPSAFDRYSDVAMQYLPASAAYALTDLAPLLREGRKVEVSLASELTPEHLKTDDIIYIGLLSGLGPLRDPVFSQSRFGFGETYDQLVDRKTGRTYTSEAFLAAPSDSMYSDYGFFSTFEGPGGNRIAIVSGTRDAAVMGVAETLSRIDTLERFEKKTQKDQDFESLLVVKGQKHTNLEAQVIASYDLDSRSIWAGVTATPASLSAK